MKELQVFGIVVPVEYGELEDKYGEYDTESKVITLKKSLKGDILYETIIHELFHAVEHRCSLNQAVSSEVMEIVIDVFAKAVVENFNVRFKRR